MKEAIKIRFLRNLRKLQEEADRFEITLPNGGQVGGLIGAIEDDLQSSWHIPAICLERRHP